MLLDHVVLWPVLSALLTAALCSLLWGQMGAQRVVSWVGTITTFAATLLLLWRVITDGIQASSFGGWDAPFGIAFAADGLGAAMAAITGLMAFATMIFGLADIRRREEHSGFHPLYHGMIAGVLGSFLTADLFNLYVWFEIMLITAMGLLVIGRTRAQLDGVLKYAVLNLFSTLLFLMAVALIYGVAGTLNMADLARVMPQIEGSATTTIAALLLLLGFGIKAGYFPLFFWLPASYHTASVTVSAIFAGLLTKVGVYACFRVFTLIFSVEDHGLQPILAWMAAGTMLFGVFGAAVQWDVRRILAFHIVSQIGYMLMGLAIATPLALAGGIFYIVHHIVVKANLFLIAGAIHRASGTFDLRKSGGLARRTPLLAVLFLVPALSLGGIPPLSGFWAKFVVIDASVQARDWWLMGVALVTGLLTLYSMSKIWTEAFWKDPVLPRPTARAIPAPMLVAIALLSTVTVVIGLYAEPFVAYAQMAGEQLTDPAPYIAAVLGGPQP